MISINVFPNFHVYKLILTACVFTDFSIRFYFIKGSTECKKDVTKKIKIGILFTITHKSRYDEKILRLLCRLRKMEKKLLKAAWINVKT